MNPTTSQKKSSFGHDVTGSRDAIELLRNSRLRCSLSVTPHSLGTFNKSHFVQSSKGRSPNQMHNRNIRKALIPITSRQTSLVVLNNIDVESVPADLRITNQPTSLHYTLNKPLPRQFKKESVLNAQQQDTSKERDTQTTYSDNVSLDSIEANDKMLTLQNDWKNIRSSSFRYSTSSFGSSASEDDIWVTRKKS